MKLGQDAAELGGQPVPAMLIGDVQVLGDGLSKSLSHLPPIVTRSLELVRLDFSCGEGIAQGQVSCLNSVFCAL